MEDFQFQRRGPAAALLGKVAAGGRPKPASCYDDVFGAPLSSSLVPTRPEDYREIFGAAAACSIPVLDLPPPSADGYDLRQCSALEYLDIFGGFSGRNFAATYHELFASQGSTEIGTQLSPELLNTAPINGTNDSRDSKRTGSKQEMLPSGNSNESLSKDRFDCSLNGLAEHLSDGTNMSTRKIGMANWSSISEAVNGTICKNQAQSIPVFSDVVKDPAIDKPLNGEDIIFFDSNSSEETTEQKVKAVLVLSTSGGDAKYSVGGIKGDHRSSQLEFSGSMGAFTYEDNGSHNPHENLGVEEAPEGKCHSTTVLDCPNAGFQNDLKNRCVASEDNCPIEEHLSCSSKGHSPSSSIKLSPDCSMDDITFNAGNRKVAEANHFNKLLSGLPTCIISESSKDIASEPKMTPSTPNPLKEETSKEGPYSRTSSSQSVSSLDQSHSDSTFLTVSDINLRTQPSQGPPPTRPPPGKPQPKFDMSGRSLRRTYSEYKDNDAKAATNYKSYSFKQTVSDSSSSFDMGVDVSSAAAASVAAIKEAMELAQAKLNSARASRERKKDSLQSRRKLESSEDLRSTDRDMNQTNQESGRIREDVVADLACENNNGQDNTFIPHKKAASFHSSLLTRSLNEKEESTRLAVLEEPQKSGISNKKEEKVGEWKVEEQFYEFIQSEKKLSKIQENALKGDTEKKLNAKSDIIEEQNASEIKRREDLSETSKSVVWEGENDRRQSLHLHEPSVVVGMLADCSFRQKETLNAHSQGKQPGDQLALNTDHRTKWRTSKEGFICELSDEDMRVNKDTFKCKPVYGSKTEAKMYMSNADGKDNHLKAASKNTEKESFTDAWEMESKKPNLLFVQDKGSMLRSSHQDGLETALGDSDVNDMNRVHEDFKRKINEHMEEFVVFDSEVLKSDQYGWKGTKFVGKLENATKASSWGEEQYIFKVLPVLPGNGNAGSPAYTDAQGCKAGDVIGDKRNEEMNDIDKVRETGILEEKKDESIKLEVQREMKIIELEEKVVEEAAERERRKLRKEKEKEKKLEDENERRRLEEIKQIKNLEDGRKLKRLEEERVKSSLKEERKRMEGERDKKRLEEDKKRLEDEEREKRFEEDRKKLVDEERERKRLEEDRKRKRLEDKEREKNRLEEEMRRLEHELAQKKVEDEERVTKQLEKEREMKRLENEERRKKKLEDEEREKRRLEEEKRKKKLEDEEREKRLEEIRKKKIEDEEREKRRLEEERRKQKLEDEEREKRRLEEERRKQKLEDEEREKRRLEEERRKQKLEDEEREKRRLEEERRKQKLEYEEREKRRLEEESRKKRLEDEERENRRLEDERKKKKVEDEEREKMLEEEKEMKKFKDMAKEKKLDWEERNRVEKGYEERENKSLQDENESGKSYKHVDEREKKFEESEERKRPEEERESWKRVDKEMIRKKQEQEEREKCKLEEKERERRKLEEERQRRRLDEIEREKRKLEENVRERKRIEEERLRKLEEEKVRERQKIEGEKAREKRFDEKSKEFSKVGEEKERERKRMEEEREREKDRQAVERATREAHERAFPEAREKADRAAAEKVTAEARQRAEKASAEALEKSMAEKSSRDRLRLERAAVERATAEARERAVEKAIAEKAAQDAKARVEKLPSTSVEESARDYGLQFQNSGSSSSSYQKWPDSNGESAIRCKARMERHQRTMDRATKALAEKNLRDIIAQREQAERNRIAETLDADVKRWSTGKEGNLRALLSTLQYILGPESGWHPIPLTDVVTAPAVKKAYRKATLCVHPDKLQQRGASIQQKYICEKVFDLLKEAWNKFNSEER